MTVGPDLRPHALLADERIVLRYAAVGVEPHEFALQLVEVLRGRTLVVFALGDEQNIRRRRTPGAIRRACRWRASAPGDRSPRHRVNACSPSRPRNTAVPARLPRMFGSANERYTHGSRAKSGDSATSSSPAWPSTKIFGSPEISEINAPSAPSSSRRPGFSVTSMRPSGRNARPHGNSSPVATSSTRSSAEFARIFLRRGLSGSDRLGARVRSIVRSARAGDYGEEKHTG